MAETQNYRKASYLGCTLSRVTKMNEGLHFQGDI